MWKERPSCFMLERHMLCRALARACAKTGKRIAARMAIIAMTTRSSIKVKARQRGTIRRIMASPFQGSVTLPPAVRSGMRGAYWGVLARRLRELLLVVGLSSALGGGTASRSGQAGRVREEEAGVQVLTPSRANLSREKRREM